MSELLLDGRVTFHCGDCLSVIKTLADNSIDSVCTDPPYALTNRTPDVKRCIVCERVLGGRDGNPTACPKCGGPLENQRSQGQRGFMGKEWDTGEVAFAVEFWAEVLRVIKPGGHVAAFGGTRSYHRLACAIEDAGFEIRDQLAWCYGTGFPKSHDVSKGIDKAAGVEREVVGERDGSSNAGMNGIGKGGFRQAGDAFPVYGAPATDAARQWEGWGTALKPAWEPICLARKPLDTRPERVTLTAEVLATWEARRCAHE